MVQNVEAIVMFGTSTFSSITLTCKTTSVHTFNITSYFMLKVVRVVHNAETIHMFVQVHFRLLRLHVKLVHRKTRTLTGSEMSYLIHLFPRYTKHERI